MAWRQRRVYFRFASRTERSRHGRARSPRGLSGPRGRGVDYVAGMTWLSLQLSSRTERECGRHPAARRPLPDIGVLREVTSGLSTCQVGGHIDKVRSRVRCGLSDKVQRPEASTGRYRGLCHGNTAVGRSMWAGDPMVRGGDLRASRLTVAAFATIWLAVPTWTRAAAAYCNPASTNPSDALMTASSRVVFRSVNGCPILEDAVVQRDVRTGGPYGLGSGRVLLTARGKTGYEFRVRDADTVQVIQHWQPIKESKPDGRAETAALTVPAYAGWLRVDIRLHGQAVPMVSSPRFAVGEVIAIAGQSLAEKAISSSALGDDAPLRS